MSRNIWHMFTVQYAAVVIRSKEVSVVQIHAAEIETLFANMWEQTENPYK